MIEPTEKRHWPLHIAPTPDFPLTVQCYLDVSTEGTHTGWGLYSSVPVKLKKGTAFVILGPCDGTEIPNSQMHLADLDYAYGTTADKATFIDCSSKHC